MNKSAGLINYDLNKSNDTYKQQIETVRCKGGWEKKRGQHTEMTAQSEVSPRQTHEFYCSYFNMSYVLFG